ncbi:MAG: 50S ribosomal protein L25 [bacterium]|nr:50S ribosomal protein L25 [bacterium]
MSQVILEANIRKETGKGAARSLRREGRIPAVLYGRHLEQPIILDVESKAVENILSKHGKTSIINLKFNDNTNQLAMLLEYQRDVFGTCLLHVDFKQIRMDEPVRASVPLILTGNSIGVKLGGVLEHHVREVEIEALPSAIPEHIEVDVTNLDMGHHLCIADVVCPEGVTILAHAQEPVVSVAIPRSVSAEETTEEAAAEEAPAAE